MNINKTCPTCNQEFVTKSYKEATYCSVKCSNTSRRINEPKLRGTKEHYLQSQAERARYTLVERPFEELGPDSRRNRVLYEQQNKCNQCGISHWLDQPLTLELEHKDGDRQNNSRDNLEALCPNCHSLTKTWRGKNKSKVKVTDEELSSALRECDTIRQALISVGLSPKGNNYYRRVKRLLRRIDMKQKRLTLVYHTEGCGHYVNDNFRNASKKTNTMKEIQNAFPDLDLYSGSLNLFTQSGDCYDIRDEFDRSIDYNIQEESSKKEWLDNKDFWVKRCIVNYKNEQLNGLIFCNLNAPPKKIEIICQRVLIQCGDIVDIEF